MLCFCFSATAQNDYDAPNLLEFTYGGYHEGSFYYVSNNTSNWYSAYAICNDFGGHLVSITSIEEQSFIETLTTEIVWIGLYQDINSVEYEENNDEGWVWVSGEDFLYENWINQEPSNPDEHHGAYNLDGNGGWFDLYNDPNYDIYFIMEIPGGCSDSSAINFDDLALIDDGSCLYSGCTDSLAFNFNSEVHVDDGSCIERVYGCIDNGYVEYTDLANTDDGSCEILLSEVLDSLSNELEELRAEATTSLSSLQQALDSWNTTIDLSAGWNMFGYGCPTSIGVADGLSNHTESIIITKDNNGNVYMPEFGFNGIGDFTPGFGYQIKLTDAIQGFSLCDWYVNDIPEDNIVSLQEEVENLQSELDCYENPQIGDYCFGGIVFYVDEIGKNGLISLSQDEGLMSWDGGLSHSENLILHGYDDWFLPSIYQLEVLYENIGPTSIFEFNFAGNNHWSSSLEDSNALAYNFVSGSIEIIDDNSSNNTLRNILPIREFGKLQYGCMDSLACNFNPDANMADESCEYPEQGYDCDGYVTALIGEIMEGGYLIYIDETGKHGIVAALEDLTEGATIDSEGNPGYQWGCFATWLSGADEQAIGTGYQNTLDIVAGCSETPIAASEALAYESGDYSDWYLPSLDELNEMYNTIGNGGSEGNIGSFSSNWYWSSSESNNYGAYDVNFGDGSTGNFSSKTKIVRVRAIRSF